jgi:hypothetical protein
MLTIETDASDSTFELPGLPLSCLSVQLDAGKTVLRFSQPNPWALSVFDLDAGAGSVEIDSLVNANGANLRLDGGTLQRDMRAALARAARAASSPAQRCRCTPC